MSAMRRFELGKRCKITQIAGEPSGSPSMQLRSGLPGNYLLSLCVALRLLPPVLSYKCLLIQRFFAGKVSDSSHVCGYQ
ncbi:hypothetical protein BC832DRAFT_479590 [Gaertneriomyces semiglobifer]|nr:hypothetical protein BC832DRAFT_479590 [Gaertneriomyces semiglobifer]